MPPLLDMRHVRDHSLVFPACAPCTSECVCACVLPRCCLLRAAVKAIAATQSSSGADGLKVVEKAKAAVSSIKVAQALDAIAAMLDATADGRPAAAAAAGDSGKATKSVDTLTNLSAYLTLYRAESQGGFDPSSVGMSEKEAANIALAFGQVGPGVRVAVGLGWGGEGKGACVAHLSCSAGWLAGWMMWARPGRPCASGSGC